MARQEPFGKFGTPQKKKYLDALRRGVGRMKAAKSAGVSNELIRLYRQEHPAFVAEEDDAQAEANERVENALFQAATGGNVTAQQVWLYNRVPERWKDQRNLTVRTKVEDFSEQELLAIAARGREGIAEAAGGAAARNGFPPGQTPG